MKEFFVSAKYKMKLPDGVSGVAGGLILPSGIARPKLARRDLTKKYPYLTRRYLDPQIYLAGLNVARCRKACVNLASYGWFGGEPLHEYDSTQQTQAEWQRRAEEEIQSRWSGVVPDTDAEREDRSRLAIDAQVRLGCERVILPSPLTIDPNTSYESECSWLDAGMQLAKRISPNTPRLATIALSDTCLRVTDPWTSPLLDLILDQVTARAPEGAYIVLEQANESGYYCTHRNTVGALLRLVGGLKAAGIGYVFTAFAGVAGLLAVATGADAWSSGWYRGERRLRLQDFEQEDGRAIPAYYSHSLGGEFHMDSDLDRVVAAGHLSAIEDVTFASEGLCRALRAGRTVASVPEWEHRPTNVLASQQHFLARMVLETERLARLPSEQIWGNAAHWVQSASGLASTLYTVGNFNPRTSVEHQQGWAQALEQARAAFDHS